MRGLGEARERGPSQRPRKGARRGPGARGRPRKGPGTTTEEPKKGPGEAQERRGRSPGGDPPETGGCGPWVDEKGMKCWNLRGSAIRYSIRKIKINPRWQVFEKI